MNLPDGFQLSQASLQALMDCPRRFYLRYILRLPWPAIETEPFLKQEEHARQGRQFHLMIQQHLLGVPASLLTPQAETPDLGRWWQNYLQHKPEDLPAERFAELQLSAPLQGIRLVAKYDMLAAAPGERFVIVDWKTSHHVPRRDWLMDRMQTRVYRYLLVRSGQRYNQGHPIRPEQVEMRYWFAEEPLNPTALPYHQMQYEHDEAFFEEKIVELHQREEGDFALTEDKKRCRFCRYRSLCDRGVEAGGAEPGDMEFELDGSFELDFDDLPEVAL